MKLTFRPPNLGNLHFRSRELRTISKISSGVREKSGGVWEKCADTVNLFFSQFL
jgi:hypothetical protein